MGKCFQRFKIGIRDAKESPDEVARNGASSRINFGQRFSWAPLAFSLQDAQPLPQGPFSSQHQLLPNVHSGAAQ
jgi:hypothetical protein